MDKSLQQTLDISLSTEDLVVILSLKRSLIWKKNITEQSSHSTS